MGYGHITRWNDENIENAIKEVMEIAKIDVMPTHTTIFSVTGNYGLTNAIRRHGGSRYWAEKLGLEIKPCESEIGFKYECECMNFLTELGYDCELTKVRYPYDIILNNNIKIDVKCGNLYRGIQGNYYTFSLEKSKPTCDVYVCYCVKDNKKQKVYVIPSCVLSSKTQLSIGEKRSKYDKYIDNWKILKKYDEFYSELLKIF